jgi:hypothetical protein
MSPASSEGTMLEPPASTNGPICAGGWLMSPASTDGHSHLKNSNFQTVSNEETINMKVVDPNKL